MEHLPLIFTVLTAAIGATWAIRSKLSDVESALREHASDDAHNFKTINDNVVQLKARQRKRP